MPSLPPGGKVILNSINNFL